MDAGDEAAAAGGFDLREFWRRGLQVRGEGEGRDELRFKVEDVLNYIFSFF